MVTICEGNEADVERVNDYYESGRRNRGAKATDFLLLAEDEEGAVIG